jgi:hypothetical protein
MAVNILDILSPAYPFTFDADVNPPEDRVGYVRAVLTVRPLVRGGLYVNEEEYVEDEIALPIDSTVRIMLDGTEFVAEDEEDNEYLNDGTCTYSLEDVRGNVVDSGNLAYVTSSSGRYIVEVGPYPETDDPSEFVAGELVERRRYYLFVDFEQDGEEMKKRVKMKAVYQ